jgi:hypothetical protein
MLQAGKRGRTVWRNANKEDGAISEGNRTADKGDEKGLTKDIIRMK